MCNSCLRCPTCQKHNCYVSSVIKCVIGSLVTNFNKVGCGDGVGMSKSAFNAFGRQLFCRPKPKIVLLLNRYHLSIRGFFFGEGVSNCGVFSRDYVVKMQPSDELLEGEKGGLNWRSPPLNPGMHRSKHKLKLMCVLVRAHKVDFFN
jgi:hypothetical protein